MTELDVLEAPPAGAPAAAPETPAVEEATAEREEIARLAYQYWQERGCPEGSPEIDWLRAEVELHATARAAGDPAETTCAASAGAA